MTITPSSEMNERILLRAIDLILTWEILKQDKQQPAGDDDGAEFQEINDRGSVSDDSGK